MVGQLRHRRVLLVRALVCSNRGGGRRVSHHTGHLCALGQVYALPLMVGAVHFILVRKGFFFAGGGCEFPVAWTVMLAVQVLVGDGAYALKPSPLPWMMSSREPVAA